MVVILSMMKLTNPRVFIWHPFLLSDCSNLDLGFPPNYGTVIICHHSCRASLIMRNDACGVLELNDCGF